jgi:hypothetical protein
MMLPKDNTTSMDQLRSALVHETVHALTRSAFSGNVPLNPEESQMVRDACTAVRGSAYNAAESDLKYMHADVLPGLRAAVKPEHQPIIDALAQGIETGNLDSLLAGRYGESDQGIVNDCLPTSGIGVLYDIAQTAGLEVQYSDLTYLQEEDAYQTFAVSLYEAEKLYAVYDKLNESSFVITESTTKGYMGHSEDDAAELVASVADAAISYTEKFGEAIKRMDDADSAAALKALHMSLALIANRHPELQAYLQDVEARVIAASQQ